MCQQVRRLHRYNPYYGESMTIDKSSSHAGSDSTELVLQEAVTLYQAGELQEAEKRYQTILQGALDHPKANHNLGALYVQKGMPADALPFFVAALEADPAHGQYWLSYVDALFQAGQKEAARDVLALAKENGLRGEDVETLDAYLTCDAPSHDAQQTVDAESRPMSQNSTLAARSGAQKTVGKPTSQEAEELVTLFAQGRYADVIPIAEIMTLKFPLHGFAWKVLGAAFNQLGKNEEALASMQKATELLPDDVEARKNLGIILKELGRTSEAESAFRDALRINPEIAEIHNNLGIILLETGRMKDAEASCRRALQIRPEFSEACNNLGITLMESGRLDEAEISCRRAIEIQPDFAGAYANLGTVLQAMGRMEEALECFRQHARLNPGNAVDQHLIASLSGEKSERAPAEYVENVFDSYAAKFDSHLQQVLRYEIPRKLREMLVLHPPVADMWEILDLGCGTGLVGAEIAPFAKRLVGVDLSAKMLEQAKARMLYQRLEQADLVPMMQNESTASYDVIVAADVFVYLGKLDDVVAETKRLLRPGGKFAFSVEECSGYSVNAGAEEMDYQLKNTGRYGHSSDYLARLAEANGYRILEMKTTEIRSEHGKPIIGYISLWNNEEI